MRKSQFIFVLMLSTSFATMARADTSKDNCERVAGEGNCHAILNNPDYPTEGYSDTTYYALSGPEDNQTMTIYGTTGEGSAASVPEFAFTDRGWSTLDSNIKSLKTSGSVNIGEYAFYYATDLTSVDLRGVQSIGDYAFAQATGLTGLLDLSGVQTIGDAAFENATGLTSVDLTGVQTIGEGAFNGDTGLTSVDLTGVQTIGFAAFYGATGLTSVDLTGVQTIGGAAFYGATGLTSVDLTGVQEIGGVAFESTGLTSLVLPDSFFDESGNMKNSISESALSGSGITNIYCPEGANCQNYFTTCPENTMELSGNCYDTSTWETVDRVPVTLNITPYMVEKGQIKVGNRTYASLNDLANNNHIKKRIYTLKEANEVAGKVNRVSIKYR